MFITFFDFITQGLLKKKQWISKIYFPIYWIFSFLTLSFLYRPLVYNFLDIKFGRRISYFLFPTYFIILLFTSLSYKNSNYFNASNSSSSKMFSNNRNYEDLINKNESFIDKVAIQSKVITNPFLKVFVIYSEKIEDRIFKFNEGLKPKDDKRGLSSGIKISFNATMSLTKQDSLKQEYLKTFNTIYSVKIDSTDYDTEFIISRWKKKDFGFETYIGIKNLSEGKHVLQVSRLLYKDSTKITFSKIPFWYYKN